MLHIFLPTFEERLGWSGDQRDPNQHIDERTHLFATMMALYPFTDNDELAKEFMMSPKRIAFYANKHYVYKDYITRRAIYIANGRSAYLRKLWAERKRKISYINTRLEDSRNHDRRNK